MSKDLKDLIESIDSANRAHLDLERIIRFLKEEVQRLTFTVNEQKKIIQNQRAKLDDIQENDLPTDIETLKEIISNQRQDLIKKDKDIEILEQTIEDITIELGNTKNYSEESEELVYTNKVIVQLTEENELKKAQIKDLEEELEILKEKFESSKQLELNDKAQQLIDAKKIIFQLTEENGLNRVKIESLKAELQELKNKLEETENLKQDLSEELESLTKAHTDIINENQEYPKKLENRLDSYQSEIHNNEKDELIVKIKDLEIENENLRTALDSNTTISDNLKFRNNELVKELNQIKNLELSRESEYRKNMTLKEEELDLINAKLEKTQNANKQLNETLIKLKEQEEKAISKNRLQLTQEKSDFQEISPNIFINMFKLLDNNSQNLIVDTLINGLNNSNRTKKIATIKQLSMIKDNKVFTAFKNLIKDNDWIVKLYLIKALMKYDTLEVKNLLTELKKDKDVDVRETAKKAFGELFN
ncbi:MAG: HEAT repeat domain-containing protein [Promethearchaeota archaeon]